MYDASAFWQIPELLEQGPLKLDQAVENWRGVSTGRRTMNRCPEHDTNHLIQQLNCNAENSGNAYVLHACVHGACDSSPLQENSTKQERESSCPASWIGVGSKEIHQRPAQLHEGQGSAFALRTMPMLQRLSLTQFFWISVLSLKHRPINLVPTLRVLRLSIINVAFCVLRFSIIVNCLLPPNFFQRPPWEFAPR